MTSNVISSFEQLSQSLSLRVEAVEVEGLTFYVRELSAGAVGEIMRRSPNIIERNGEKVTDNSTNKLDMAFVVSRSVVTDPTGSSLFAGGNHGEKKWSQQPARIVRPLFKAALEISGLTDDDDEGNDSDS